MRKFTLPLALSLASSLAFAAPPARKVEPNAHGVARSTSVRNEEATENASGPRLVMHTARRNVRRTGVHMASGRSSRAATRARSGNK